MSDWIFDATPLIYLAKADRLSVVADLDGSRTIPQRVYDEVVTIGLEHAYPDARRIERTIEDGVFDVQPVENGPLFERLGENPQLTEADCAVLVRARRDDAIAVMDERYGRDVADTEGIETRGTAFLVCTLVQNGHLSSANARRTIETMIDAGWHCSTNLYATILRKLESLE